MLFQLPSDIEGAKIVMREVLMDGPIGANSFDQFVEQRSQYLCEENPNEYFDKSVPELEKIRAIQSDSIVFLWFEDDLFCQVNLWYCLYQLQNPNIEKVLIRPERGFIGFAGYKPEELVMLLNDKIPLSSNDVELFANLWEAYRDKEWTVMKDLISFIPDNLYFIKPAILAQLDRLPEGKGRPEKSLRVLAKKHGNENFTKIFKEFCELEAVYGMGDVQVKLLLNKL